MAERIKPEEALTPIQIEYLISGYNLDGDEPFASEGEAALAWKENREYLMSLRGPRKDDDPTFYGATYPHGTRPAGFWKYEDHPSETRFGDQLKYLKENGLLFLGEEKAYLAEMERRKAELTKKDFDD